MKKDNLIYEIAEPHVVDSISNIVKAEDISLINQDAVTVSQCFGSPDLFKEILEGGEDSKLIASFKKNLTLLIQKTWVEKTDEAVKEQVLYNLEQFCAYAEDNKYAEEYRRFGQIISDVVYLMFGPQSKQPEFSEYALRIDPEFGIFWWYIQSLPETSSFSSEKCRVLILLGMYFLANY